ncbi:hypothetical protein BSNK01_07760 [Bacillaceae bacterium]
MPKKRVAKRVSLLANKRMTRLGNTGYLPLPIRAVSSSFLLVLAFALMFVVSGCSGEPEENASHLSGPAAETLASLAQEAKAVEVALPAFLADSPAMVRETYALAYAHRDLLQYMPCFCGCGDAGHTSNRDCFIRDVRDNGAVVWDKMSAT